MKFEIGAQVRVIAGHRRKLGLVGKVVECKNYRTFAEHPYDIYTVSIERENGADDKFHFLARELREVK